MSSQLQETFSRFVDSAKVSLRLLEDEELPKERKILKLASETALPRLVDTIEGQREFRQLVTESRSTFAGDFHQKSSEHDWQQYVHDFFCQSGLYLKLMYGSDVSIDTAFTQYCASFEAEECKTTYLVPLEFVTFASNSMDFRSFQIRRFSVQELGDLMRNRLNGIFYPYAAITPESLRLLSEYWFLSIVMKTAVVPISPGSRLYPPAS